MMSFREISFNFLPDLKSIWSVQVIFLTSQSSALRIKIFRENQHGVTIEITIALLVLNWIQMETNLKLLKVEITQKSFSPCKAYNYNFNSCCLCARSSCCLVKVYSICSIVNERRDITRCLSLKRRKVKHDHSRRLSHQRSENKLTFSEILIFIFNQTYVINI